MFEAIASFVLPVLKDILWTAAAALLAYALNKFQSHLQNILAMSTAEPAFRNGTNEYLLRDLIHSNYQPMNVHQNGVGLKLVVETSRESRRRLARQKKQTKPKTALDILNELK